MSTLEKKFKISFNSALLFFVINLPQTYKLTNYISPIELYTNKPTYNGLLVHTLAFFMVSYMTMGDKPAELKIKYSLYGSLIFYFLSSSPLYCLTSKLFGNTTQVPNIMQILLHSVIYCLTLVAVMYLPDK